MIWRTTNALSRNTKYRANSFMHVAGRGKKKIERLIHNTFDTGLNERGKKGLEIKIRNMHKWDN